MAKQVTDLQQLSAQVKQIDAATITYEDFKKEMVAYSLVEDFD